MTDQRTIQCLIEAGLNHQELALALECSGQTARGYLREYRATKGPVPVRSWLTDSAAWTWMGNFSLEQLFSLGTENPSLDKSYFRREFTMTNRWGQQQVMPAGYVQRVRKSS